MADKIRGLTVEISADAKQFNKQMAAVRKDAKSSQAELNALQKSLEMEYDPSKFTRAQKLAQEAIDALGIENIKWLGGKLMLTCTKPGSALVTLKYIAGGNNQGGGQITGGMLAQQEFAFIARPNVTVDEGTLESNNPGGWL